MDTVHVTPIAQDDTRIALALIPSYRLTPIAFGIRSPRGLFNHIRVLAPFGYPGVQALDEAGGEERRSMLGSSSIYSLHAPHSHALPHTFTRLRQ